RRFRLLGLFFLDRPRHPAPAAGLVEAADVVGTIGDLGLEAEHAGASTFLAAEIKPAVPLAVLELEPDGEVAVGGVGDQEPVPRLGAGGGAMKASVRLLDGPVAPAERAPAGERPAVPEGLPGALAQVLEPDVLEPDPAGLAGVDLKGDEPFEVHRVDQVGAGDAVEPGAQVRPDRQDGEVVPAVALDAFPGPPMAFQGVEPAPPTLLVKARRPGTRQGVDLALIAEDAAVAVGRRLLVAAELDARVAGLVELDVDLED